MGNTKAGAKKSVATILSRNPNHFREIGAKGGSAKKTKPSGFAAMPFEKRSAAGKKGGANSRRSWTAEQKLEWSEYMLSKRLEKQGANR